MSPKERVSAILNRQPVDRLPVDIWYTPEILADLIAHSGAQSEMDMWRKLGLDKIANITVGYNFDSQTSRNVVGTPSTGNRTMWGVSLREITSGKARYNEILKPPLEDMEEPEELDDYPYWPDPDKFDYLNALDNLKQVSGEFCTIGPWVSFYEIYCSLRGLEQAMMDLAEGSAFVEACLDRIEAVQTEVMKRFFEKAAGDLDLVFISDDIGGQNGLLFSPAMWRRHLEPRMKRWCDLVHAYGMKVFYHSDGGLEPLIQPLIDCGIDVLNPIQHNCPGMDTRHLKDKFGDQVIFHGGIDTQKILPFGTPESVRDETRQCMDTLGSNGTGYIVASCHNVQAGTPVENILAMIETVKES